jgi:transketolase
MKGVPGVDMSTGSLGLGVSAACGMAKSAKISGDSYRVYAVLGDGEVQEGQVWEAAMFAAHYKLDNLCAIVDNNGLQIDGRIDDIMSPNPIDEKFKAFGWNVICIDAHDFDEIEKAFHEAQCKKEQPTVIIQKSVKGKGVSFMEGLASWHGAAPNEEQYNLAMSQLNAILTELEGK